MRTDWMTPRPLFDALSVAANGFRVDAAADRANSLCERFYGPGSPDGEDALKVEQWFSPAFCNPPYDRLAEFTAKFAEQSALGVTIIAIIPASTGTRWFHENIVKAPADVVFLTGRIPFIAPEGVNESSNRHDSAILLYSPESSLRVSWWDWKYLLKGHKDDA